MRALLSVRGPTLPEIIKKIIISLPDIERSKEKLQLGFNFEPNDNPTVPNAEKISKRSFKGCPWSIV